ncbi:MAG: SDR family NAD(P)-dependent oxidoreductase [Paracoccaceae bacterium]|jgi:NAD(P)-dependent dehydrogenase (short-subunit alcohol dehydrogenase family)|nr:SDR family NAD(P)-dependent oxidoreductase [Paracoccaceae bacterium]MDG1371038.1 SDR family NAD(P)-dependent oxidoreductase [Paracoccaceae bacterium]MDG1970182.1 SDR family NAD(P)-dependent oxidoreductase [Paracoccaceae bacterium]
MDSLTGKAAFVTGAASGIGLGITEALVAKGARVMMADIDVDELARVSDRLRAEGADVATAIVDVSLREDQQRAADQMVQAFGGVDILINNAGVGGGGPFERWNDKGWDWTVGVNLMSVIYGFDIFGRIMAQQGAGHIVSTASIAGMMPLDSSAYSATKFGVVAVSESLREELAPKGVGVSLLCPGFVNTNIIHSHRHLPERFGENLSDGDEVPVDDAALERIKTISDLIRTGHDPRFVGDLVCDGILNNHPYIFTDREHEPTIRARFEGILAAYERL